MKIRSSRPKFTQEERPQRPKTVLLTPEEEDELADYITELQKIVLRLTINDVMILANQVAEKHNKKLLFRNNAIMAERLWVLDLMRRHPKIILRIPDINSKPGGFNMAEIDYFYKHLSEVYDVKKIPPDRIYTTDYVKIFLGESTTYIINQIGNKDNKDGIIIRAKLCFSTDGHYMPPMMIFPQKHRPDLTNNDDAWRIFMPNGSLTNELFLQWLRRFIFLSGAKKEQQVLLLFDGQPMYTKSIEIVKITRNNGVNMISFPPFTQNKLQPTDDVFINELSKAYDKVVETWFQLNPGNKLTTDHVVKLFDKILSEETAAIAAIEAFKRCGIYPLNTNLFTENDFIPVVTKPQIYKEKTPPPTNTNQNLFSSSKYYFDLYYNPRPGCSFWPD
ncbi:PREDICTED: uncharacterized protein LOC106128245 [Papilio xuthus]|uniref:Uncharacterized protein LOC106128245 n=1 Tax=Papilio xuthus TaxID=66420 RepID=A0AAJ6ZYF7_PAPXU|nr:PREDICTED: uncharacterized protein LOC106128245 [Papilio xuthus]